MVLFFVSSAFQAFRQRKRIRLLKIILFLCNFANQSYCCLIFVVCIGFFEGVGGGEAKLHVIRKYLSWPYSVRVFAFHLRLFICSVVVSIVFVSMKVMRWFGSLVSMWVHVYIHFCFSTCRLRRNVLFCLFRLGLATFDYFSFGILSVPLLS